jgi:histidine triad (HIT) family protein
MTQVTACIFCAIVAGTAPCLAVYEDEDVLAFMDHRPLNPGHVEVTTRTYTDTCRGGQNRAADD